MSTTLPTTITLTRHAGFWAARWPGSDPERVQRMFDAPLAVAPLRAKADDEADPDRIAELG